MKEREYWYNKNVLLEKDKVTIHMNGEVESITIPSKDYPLLGNYEVFHRGNTEDVKDGDLIKIINQVKISTHFPVKHTMSLYDLLKEAGYQVHIYSGWLFPNNVLLPYFHYWLIIENEEDTNVIDLSDNLATLANNAIKLEEDKEIAIDTPHG